MTDRTQPDSASTTGSTHIIRYALELGLLWIDGDGRDKVREALDALDTLESQLEAIGAGGVSGPLMGRASPPTAQAEGWRPIETAPKGERVLLWSEITRGEPFIGDWAEYARYNHPQFTHWSRWDGLPPTSADGVEHG